MKAIRSSILRTITHEQWKLNRTVGWRHSSNYTLHLVLISVGIRSSIIENIFLFFFFDSKSINNAIGFIESLSFSISILNCVFETLSFVNELTANSQRTVHNQLTATFWILYFEHILSVWPKNTDSFLNDTNHQFLPQNNIIATKIIIIHFFINQSDWIKSDLS